MSPKEHTFKDYLHSVDLESYNVAVQQDNRTPGQEDSRTAGQQDSSHLHWQQDNSGLNNKHQKPQPPCGRNQKESSNPYQKSWKIEFKWVKAHAGIHGNEIADRLGIKWESSPSYCGQLPALKKIEPVLCWTVFNGDVIHVIKKLGKQLTTLVLDGRRLTDVAYSHLNNCARYC